MRQGIQASISPKTGGTLAVSRSRASSTLLTSDLYRWTDSRAASAIQATCTASGKLDDAAKSVTTYVQSRINSSNSSRSRRSVRICSGRFLAVIGQRPVKTAQTFWVLDADTHQPVCFTMGTASRSVVVAGVNPEIPWLYNNKLDFRFC
jgi:hypothetical protein